MIYLKKPDDFDSKFEAVGCFVRNGDKIILLKRLTDKSEGGTWGIPSGKIEPEESLKGAMAREIKEETGIIFKEKDLIFRKTIYVRYSYKDFTYHIFEAFCEERKIEINPEEHQEGVWIGIDDTKGLTLIEDLNKCIDLIFKK